MKIAIRYFTDTGNTKKLADTVAEAVGVEAVDVSQPLTEDVDILFLCNSVYWYGIAKEVRAFLVQPGAKIGKIVNVSSAAIVESSYRAVKHLTDELGLVLSEEEFHCKGSFSAMHKGKPDADDLEKLKAFAKGIAEKA